MIKVFKLNGMSKLAKDKKRVGRGHASYGGKAGRGSDGQKARETVKTEGGQFPTYLRYKKRGFVSLHKPIFNVITLKDLLQLVETNPGIKVFNVKTILDALCPKSDLKKLKVIGYNLTPEQFTVLQNGYVFEAHKTTEGVNKLNLIKIVYEESNATPDSK